jgi:hypothetical protein
MKHPPLTVIYSVKSESAIEPQYHLILWLSVLFTAASSVDSNGILLSD